MFLYFPLSGYGGLPAGEAYLSDDRVDVGDNAFDHYRRFRVSDLGE